MIDGSRSNRSFVLPRLDCGLFKALMCVATDVRLGHAAECQGGRGLFWQRTLVILGPAMLVFRSQGASRPRVAAAELQFGIGRTLSEPCGTELWGLEARIQTIGQCMLTVPE